ncbi:hypothetical protein SDC9_125926 [bioreactor metagenome]|uniref:Uncharacterized protein n=1 Tax=bioreactor metagenome TaxID=1076179 RepID=A0A645CPS5_9ZZZZ
MLLQKWLEAITMLFDKKIEPRCSYCQKSVCLEPELVLCVKKGVMPAGERCSAFRYDPLRRVPPRAPAPDFSRLKDEDFVL